MVFTHEVLRMGVRGEDGGNEGVGLCNRKEAEHVV